jgi:hypothetical protein
VTFVTAPRYIGRRSLHSQFPKLYTMRVSRSGALAVLVIVVLWAASPAVVCLLPMGPMTPAERECCTKMAHQCGSSMMPASHSCCQAQQDHTAVSPVATYSATRPFSVALVPHTASLLMMPSVFARELPAFDASPPGPAPGCTSILRI